MISTRKMKLSGWGGYPRVDASVCEPADLNQLEIPLDQSLILRGQGRSYGDAAISTKGVVVLSERSAHFTLTDDGKLETECGATIEQVLLTSVARGWFPAVVPGTKIVSIGGCIAADVHGKNHHRDGSFSEHVDSFELMLADGSRRICSPKTNQDLFWATVGGMGLTGVITKATLRMTTIETPFMVVQHRPTNDLTSSLTLLQDKSEDDRYSVMWIDCLAKGRRLGRSVMITGHHARLAELSAQVQREVKTASTFDLKFDFPDWVLNRFSVAAFNEAYFRRQGLRKKPFIQHYDNFFFPLDRIGNWNRMYGRRGFIQYQCVLPLATAETGLQLLLEELSGSRRPSFLAVLKLFRAANPGLLSFPMSGYTLTLDLPLSDPELFSFLDRLDQIVLNCGGRVYLAKDARLKPETFSAMYPRLQEWLAIKSQVDPGNRFQSDLSRRLELRSFPSAVTA